MSSRIFHLDQSGEEHGPFPMSRQRGIGRFFFVLVILFSVTCAGFYFRYAYASSSSPYIDEHTTMWVALRTLRFGYPVFSTGSLYTQGLLFTYVEALSFKLFGFSEFIARTPSLIVSVISIPLLYWLGKRLFSAEVGLIAAVLLAFDPQAIGWGGRARSYSFLLFFVMLVVLFAYEGVILRDRALYRRLQLLVFLGAVYAHNEAILLFPILVVAGLLWRGWRWFLRPVVLMEYLMVVVGMALSFYLYVGMRPEGWVSVGEGRPAISPSLNVLGAMRRYGPFFLGPDQLPFVALITLFLLAGFGYLLVRGWRKRGEGVLALLGEEKGLAFLCVTFLIAMTEMVFLVGERRFGARYLFILVPVFFLIASLSLVKFLDFLGTLPAKRGLTLPSAFAVHSPYFWRTAVTGFVTVLIALFALPASLAAANRQEFGYDSAFKYVSEQRKEGDEVMAFNIAACMLYLDERCDYVAVEKDFHSYVTLRGGYWIGAWGGVAVLFTDEALEGAIEEADRMWFVIDEMRFHTRYTDDFIQYVWDRMTLVAKEGGVFVFLAESPPPPPLAIQGSLYYSVDEKVALLGYRLNDDYFEPGDEVRLSLRWQGLTHMLQSYSVFVHLVDTEGVMWTQHDGAPLRGLHPTTHWVAGEIISDPHELTLPAGIPSGRYRLEVGVYLPERLERLAVMDEAGNYLGDTIIVDYVQVQEEPPETFSPQHLVGANLGNKVTLWGYDVDTTVAGAGETACVVLYWEAQGEVEEDYTVFVHLIDDVGRIWGQRDSAPEHGFYLTSYWGVGEVVRDEYEVMIDPGAPPGLYEIEVGMYLNTTGERLPYIDEQGQAMGDAMVLGDIRVRE